MTRFAALNHETLHHRRKNERVWIIPVQFSAYPLIDPEKAKAYLEQS